VVSYEEDIELRENHSMDSDVRILLEAEDVVFKYEPVDGNPGSLLFGQSIVSVGADTEGNILSFICPQRSFKSSLPGYSLTLTGEVEVGQVEGSIDPVAGDANIYVDEPRWLFWGNIETPSGNSYGLTKDDAALIPIRDPDNSSGLLTLSSIERSTHGKGNLDNIFSSYFANGLQGSATQESFLQDLMINCINVLYPGLATKGTELGWNIDLQAPTSITGESYEDIAHSLHIGH